MKGKYIILILLVLIMAVVLISIGIEFNTNEYLNESKFSQSCVTDYISKNLEKYKDRIKKESGFEGKIVSEKDGEKETKYLEFDIDDITKIKFETNGINVMVVRQLNESNVPNPKKELTVKYISTDEDAHVIATLKYKDGSVPVDYKANNFDKPLDTGNEKYEQNDLKIKAVASTEELNKLTSTVHSIYNVLEEIYKENNVK